MKGLTMEEGPSPQNHNGQLSNSSGGISVGTKQGNEEQNQRTQYSIPGILHFIQHEWARFEMERTQWEVERAELQARIAFLQGERKGQENLKNDLVRRIKMLEYALKQERAKYYKLKYGTEMPGGDLVEEPPEGSEGELEGRREGDPLDGDSYLPSSQNLSWRQGRQLLRQYLQEIGYSDTLIDVRSNRVRSLLGLSSSENEENLNNLGPTINGGDIVKRTTDAQNRKKADDTERLFLSFQGAGGPGSLEEKMILDAEVAVMANFDFLTPEGVDVDEDDAELSDDLDDEATDEQDHVMRQIRSQKGMVGMDDVDADTVEVLQEFDFLNSSEHAQEEQQQTEASTDWGGSEGGGGGFPQGGRSRSLLAGGREDETIETALGLGELAQLTVNNEADQTYDVTANKEPLRKTWNAKYTLRSHFDGVRALAFHPTEPVLITASEDHTLKLWNLQKTVPAKKSASLDVEPVYTFRGHTGAVLSVCVASSGEYCYSGGLDGLIHCWKLPDSNIDPYDAFEPSVLSSQLRGHVDAVWGLALHPSNGHLLSCSADGTVRLWDPQNSQQTLLSAYAADQDGIPTSVDFVKSETAPVQMVCSYNTNNCVIYDIETGKPVIRLDTQQLNENGVNQQINRVVCHPTLGITVTGGEDRQVRFWENSTGRLVHSMVAHLDAVTALAMDPNGLYLLSGSHDCSIRLWHLDNKTCVQEITAHRKKFDEAIFDVAFHPSKPYIASAGADALAKVFV